MSLLIVLVFVIFFPIYLVNKFVIKKHFSRSYFFTYIIAIPSLVVSSFFSLKPETSEFISTIASSIILLNAYLRWVYIDFHPQKPSEPVRKFILKRNKTITKTFILIKSKPLVNKTFILKKNRSNLKKSKRKYRKLR